jgi:arginyl-tRNA synthetase
MKQQIEDILHSALLALQQDGTLKIDSLPSVHIEHARDKQHGDYACNIAMLLAKPLQLNPRQIAETIIAKLQRPDWLINVDIAGPGFINFTLAKNALHPVIVKALEQGDYYGHLEIGKGKRINIEILSSNPTGPLHVGHGRNVAYGASVANVLATAGYEVEREYYVNDAGRQMHILATSVWLRYLEVWGENVIFPRNGYQGEYVTAIARELKVAHEDKFLRPIDTLFIDLPADEDDEGNGDKEAHIDALIERTKTLLGPSDYQIIFDAALTSILDDIREDLSEFGVHYQRWFPESSLVKNGDIERGIQRLAEHNTLYDKEGAKWFRASEYGDDKDRVVIRSNGSYTYLAGDIGYHFNKFQRGYDQILNVFGSDHHGYSPRIYAFLKAAGEDISRLHFLTVQFAILYRGKTRMKMSTRGGQFVTLRQLREEVGNDAARYFFVMRKREQHLDFDLELAKSRSNENPVYYIQYAHARICSVFRQLETKHLQYDQTIGLANLDLLNEAHEAQLIQDIARYPEVIASAAEYYEPHLIAHYLQELATNLHSYYNAHQFIVEDEKSRNARLALISATRIILVNGLRILGVSAPESM